MEKIVITKRETVGKAVKSLLTQGIVPVVIYNANNESFNGQVNARDAQKFLRTATSTTILDVDYEGKTMKAVVKETTFDPVKDTVRHISFYQIDENKPMIFTVPFELTGVSMAVKNNLGVLVKALPSVDVRCKLVDLKPAIVIDISILDHPGQTITVKDIKLPEGMTLPNDSQLHNAIVTITQLQKTDEAKPEAAAEATTEAAK